MSAKYFFITILQQQQCIFRIETLLSPSLDVKLLHTKVELVQRFKYNEVIDRYILALIILVEDK